MGAESWIGRRGKTTARRLAALGVVAASSAALAACKGDAPAPLSGLDEAFYGCKVEPIVVKRCGMLACHGRAERFYRVFSRNRFRFDQEPMNRDAIITVEERRFNYEAALAMVDLGDPDRSFLLKKPLDRKGGGYYHGGELMFHLGDVFLSTDDPEYKILSDWVHGAKEAAPCP